MINLGTDKAVQQVHENSLVVLGEVGIRVDNDRARSVFIHHGAKMTVVLPQKFIEEVSSPGPWEFHGLGAYRATHAGHAVFTTSE